MFGAPVSLTSMHCLGIEELTLLPAISSNASADSDRYTALPMATRDDNLMVSASDPRSTVMVELLGPLITDAPVRVMLSVPMEVFDRATPEGSKLATSTGSSKSKLSWSNDRFKVQLSTVGDVASGIKVPTA